MRNQFDGTCYRCGLPVKAGTGYFEKIRREDRKPGDGQWRTQHCYRTHNGGVTCEMAKAAEKAVFVTVPAAPFERGVVSGCTAAAAAIRALKTGNHP